MSEDTNRTYREWLEEALALDKDRWEELENELARLRRVPRRPNPPRQTAEDQSRLAA